MGRKDRDTADYFPRAVRDGDSMAAVEMLYGNDGYTLWGKTMQALGAAEGHFLDLSVRSRLLKHAAASRLSIERAEQIIETFAELEMVDAELWRGARVLWSQNLVDNLQSLYRKRGRPAPSKPSIPNLSQTPISVNDKGITGPETRHSSISGAGNHQSIVKHSKAKKKPFVPRADALDDGEDKGGVKLAQYLKDRILAWKPNAKVPEALGNWIRSGDRLLRLDKRPFDQAVKVMDWATADSFWQGNVLSMDTFRKQYDRLEDRMNKAVGGNGGGPKPLPRASEPLPDVDLCAMNVRQTGRGIRWCEKEDVCAQAFKGKCRKYDAFPGVPRKEKTEEAVHA